jgi:hypothetical protein
LKGPESDEGIQENPRKSKPFFLGFSWFFLVWLGGIWPEARPAIASDRLRYEDAPALDLDRAVSNGSAT